MTKIVGIAGSLRNGSYSVAALQCILTEIRTCNAETELLDLKGMSLPFCDGSKDYPAYPDVARMRKKVADADGLILVTPEYHGSISGVLKNALDLMSADELSGKLVGLASVLGGQTNSNALNHLRLILRWVHAWVLPEQVAFGQAYNCFAEDGTLQSASLQTRVKGFAESMVLHSQRLNQVK